MMGKKRDFSGFERLGGRTDASRVFIAAGVEA